MEKQGSLDRTGRKKRADSMKRAVCELLECHEDLYNEYVFNSGLDYLKAYLNRDEYGIKLLQESPIFWAWWKNHFTNRDENFLLLHKNKPIVNLEIRRQLYEQYNNGKKLARDIHPNSVVLHESYATMITELVEEETKKQHA